MSEILRHLFLMKLFYLDQLYCINGWMVFFGFCFDYKVWLTLMYSSNGLCKFTIFEISESLQSWKISRNHFNRFTGYRLAFFRKKHKSTHSRRQCRHTAVTMRTPTANCEGVSFTVKKQLAEIKYLGVFTYPKPTVVHIWKCITFFKMVLTVLKIFHHVYSISFF